MDLSVPRNIHPEVKSIPGLALLNIDDVNYKLNQNSQLKSQAAQKACKEVKQKSVQLFTEWQQRDLIYNDKKEVRKGC